MPATAKPPRDAFTFSLGGTASVNSYAFVPAIADDVLNDIRDKQLRRDPGNRRDVARKIEDFLARFFASGCREPV